MKKYFVINFLFFSNIIYGMENIKTISFPSAQILETILDKHGYNDIVIKTELTQQLENRQISPLEVFVIVQKAAKNYNTNNGKTAEASWDCNKKLREALLPLVVQHDPKGLKRLIKNDLL
jgi:hypothetical protein